MPALADPPSYGGTLSLCRPLRRLLRAADDARAALTAQRAARLRRLAARWLPFEPTCVRQMGRSWDRRLTTLHMAELCAAIDRGLGNVHLLRLLLGPPCTLNVRNLVWHGFPAPGELPPALLSLLLLLTAAVGALLADRAVPARRQLAYSQALLSCLQLPAVADCQVEDLWRLVLRSPFVPVVMRPHWRLALALYRHGRFGQGAVLLLPQLEHCLRLAFCALAGCPERRRTAEHRELYTTLDHLVAGGGGPLRALCGDAVLCQLCDLLVWPAGPRLRDRLAHGEVETARLPAPLAHQLLWLTGQLLVTTTDWAERQPAPAGGTAQHSGDGAEQQQYLTDRSEQQRYSGDWSDLEPVIRELEEADDCELVLGCEDASVESSDAGAPCDRARCPGEFGALCAGRARDWYHPSFHQFSVLQRAVRDLSAAAEETVRRELPPEGRPALTRLEPLADGALSLRPPTLRRPRREAELLTQLQQLVAALDGAWRRAATAGATWRRLQEAGQLRSRQRATWGRMQSALPELHRLTAGLLRLVTRQMDGLATAASTDPDGDGGGDSSGRSLTRTDFQFCTCTFLRQGVTVRQDYLRCSS
ncbi:Endoplasmic reticulum membrane-associated RNA degradation protein [Amphibalanus amphitrite]|uniref:Endoplasmic reticulum membrane-associated RNA degradation protein n=1 Tax=Amphibalanus amphitrite TaxID=1232801 RepID=A0A6A4VHL2_AMPAM|nr:Endoplasmic reticulum membrane-associated RNA degradation protein [Amphibalanus amphitrite]